MVSGGYWLDCDMAFGVCGRVQWLRREWDMPWSREAVLGGSMLPRVSGQSRGVEV